VGISEVSKSISQPLSKEELYGFVQQLTEQQKEDEDERNRGTKFIVILSAIDMAAYVMRYRS